MQLNINQTAKVELLVNPKYYLALTALFRDEARFLKEWIEFYKLMGVEHFYLFNHLSTDNYQEVLDPYINEGIVEVTTLTYEPNTGEEWYVFQQSTYKRVCDSIRNDVEWLAIIDTDEFLYPIQEDNLTVVLKNYDNYASLSVNWRIFGTNDVQRISNNELMIESLVKRNNVADLTVKTIVKPRYIEDFHSPHFAIMKTGYEQITENYNKFYGYMSSIASNNVLTINHYVNRDKDFFYERKLGRKHVIHESLSAEERELRKDFVISKDKEFSTIYDDNILKFALALRKKIFKEQDIENSAPKLVDLSNDKKLAQLPNNLSYIVEVTNNTFLPYSLMNGYGYEPYLLRKIMAFSQEGETYVEVGAGYGEFALQMSKKVGENGKVLAFEIDNKLFQYLSANVFLNDQSNIEIRNIIPNAIKGDVVRINSIGNECKIIESIKDIASNQRLFVTVQSDMQQCLQALVNDGFIFIDINKFNEDCSYVNYQHEYLLEISKVVNNTEVLIIKEKDFEYFRKISSQKTECISSMNQALFFNSIAGRDEEVKYMISVGADVNYYNPLLKGTSLYYAIDSNFTNTVKILIEAGADIELRYKKEISPLYHAIEKQNVQIVQQLLEAGAETNNIFDHIGATVLAISVQENYFEISKLLLEHGANPNIKAKNEATPLYISVGNNNYNITKLLLEYNADVEYAFSSGSTPLYLAAYLGNDEILKLLLEYEANQNITVAGMNALHRALQNDHLSSAVILAGSIENLCTSIQGSEYENKYTELCGEIKCIS